MNAKHRGIFFGFCLALLLFFGTSPASAQSTSKWITVVNNGDVMPGTAQLFNSYNQPSVNQLGLVVFRARSKGADSGGGGKGKGEEESISTSAVDEGSGGKGQGSGGQGGGNGSGNQPVHGIYSRNMLQTNTPIVRIFDKSSTVPQPNNMNATFIEFPAFPRVEMLTNTIVTRGSSQPVLRYTLADGTDTRAGTSALLATERQGPVTAATQLGMVPGYQQFQVPGAAAGVKFDQFPGAPAVSGNKVIFKGNYTEGGASKTGIYFRNPTASNGTAAVQLIANTNTRIPNQAKTTNVLFGSTAPPSAALDFVVFAGFDNEDNPSYGGIYWTLIQSKPTLRTLVGIGQQVPGEDRGIGFTRFGEGLAFDGRNVAFWGAWGKETRSITLTCPTDGNADLIAYCNKEHPAGYIATVPVHQGIFVYDILFGTLTPLVKAPNNFDDFLFWTFSGKAPGSAGSADGEPARWRSSAFAAVAGVLRPFQVVFKARKDTVDGIYLAGYKTPLTTLVDTSMSGRTLDGEAPLGSMITSVGIERESLRGVWLTLTASMLDPITSESWGGIYLRQLP